MTGMQVVAHRGSSALYAENSWAAFNAAVADGADAIECDVQGTLDGVLVIRHDLAVGQKLVAQCTAAEIESLEPDLVRLTDLLDWAPSTGIDLLIEVKDPAFAEPVGDVIVAGSWRERTVVGGFHGPALAAVKSRTPSIATSLMVGTVIGPYDLERLAKTYKADGVHLCWEARSPHPHRLLDATTVARLHKARLAVTLWHEEREDELRALVALRPDAICTNTPAILRRIVDEFEATPATETSATFDRIQLEG